MVLAFPGLAMGRGIVAAARMVRDSDRQCFHGDFQERKSCGSEVQDRDSMIHALTGSCRHAAIRV